MTNDPQGGVFVGSASRVVTVGEAYGPLAAATREGHALAGWWTAPGAAGIEVGADTVVTAAAPHTSYARWTADRLTVRFDSEGWTPCPLRTVTYGATQGASGPVCVPTRDGHVFGGWWIGDVDVCRSAVASRPA